MKQLQIFQIGKKGRVEISPNSLYIMLIYRIVAVRQLKSIFFSEVFLNAFTKKMLRHGSGKFSMLVF